MTLNDLKKEVAKEVMRRDMDRIQTIPNSGPIEAHALAALINMCELLYGEDTLNAYQAIVEATLIMAAKYPTMTGRVLEAMPKSEHDAMEPLVDAIAELYEERR